MPWRWASPSLKPTRASGGSVNMQYGTSRSRLVRFPPFRLAEMIRKSRATAVDAVNVLASPILFGLASLILDRLRLSRLPAIHQWPEGAEAGWFIAYGPRLDEVFRQFARQVAKLLRGAKVADVPVEQPTKFELVINAKTARTLGLTIPPTLLARADQVIE
jgi:putative ABC transport system substrate-binding protein